MAFRLAILGSGSAGNCALLQTNEACVLIDAGLSARKIEQRLTAFGLGWDRIDAILLTHEHGDHITGLSGLKKHPRIPVFATAGTIDAAREGLDVPVAWQTFSAGASFTFRDLDISTFAVPHDARDPVGYFVSSGRDDLFAPRRSLAWLTDLGYVPEGIRARIQEVDILSLEANYCPELLKADTRRPWSLRQRISGRHGHLSNAAARALLHELNAPRWRHIVLTHLSRDCNRPETLQEALAGLDCLGRCSVTIAAAEGAAAWIEA